MKVFANFHLLSALIWTTVVVAYLWRWSNLNQPLDPRLLTFLVISGAFSAFFGFLRVAGNNTTLPLNEGHKDGRKQKWLVTCAFTAGFLLDFAYRGGIPITAEKYSGYDVTASVQARVGIPGIHVALIAGSIFYAILLVERFCATRLRTYLHQFLLIVGLLVLNNSRGYITFCLLGAGIIFASANTRRSWPAVQLRTLIVSAGVIYGLVVGIGVFGNLRSGYAWNDTSYITTIGRYTDAFPSYVDDNVKWTYTYLTSSLANLNYNITNFAGGGSPIQGVVNFVPETFTKHDLALQAHIRYEVTYLNASTGYIGAYYFGGGIAGLYVSYAIQVLLLEFGAWLTRTLGQAVLLYSACASVVAIVFVFYNPYSTTATSLLLPLAISVSVLRYRAQKRDSAERPFTDRGSLAGSPTSLKNSPGKVSDSAA